MIRFNAQGQIVSTTTYKSGQSFDFYANIEPRLLVNFILTPHHSIKLSAERQAQYIQLIEANPVGSPVSYWLPAGGGIKPQLGEQYFVGFFNNFFNNVLETSVEFYYKNLHNQIDYKDGASTALNAAIENEMIFGKGRAYGMEILLRKNLGKWNGWMGYTLAASRRSFPDINDGKEFRAVQDRTHDLSLVCVYTPTPKHILSGAFVYYTGNAATYPTSTYQFGGTSVLNFSDRNAYRLPNSHRLDVSYTYKPNKKPKHPKRQVSHVFSIYNIYAQKNPYFVTYEPSGSGVNITQQSLFTIVPSYTYQISF